MAEKDAETGGIVRMGHGENNDWVMPPCSGADLVNYTCNHGLREKGDRGWVTCFGCDIKVSNKIALIPPCVEES